MHRHIERLGREGHVAIAVAFAVPPRPYSVDIKKGTLL